MNQLAAATPELVAAAQVLLFKQAQRIIRCNTADMGVIARQYKCCTKFFHIDLPITAKFYLPTQCQQLGEVGGAVDPALELPRLWPGVGVEQEVVSQLPARLCREPPEIITVGLYQQVVVCWGCLVFCQPVGGFVDANYKAVGVAFRQPGGALAGAAEGIEDQGSRLHLHRAAHLLKGVQAVRRRRPPVFRREMPGNQLA